jgi:NifU-like protein
MWDYSEKVCEHFFNPRNARSLEGANGVGDVGSIKCGDALRLMLKVDPGSDKIVDATFQTFGCGSAIASSSALTEIIKGKTLDEALQVSNQDIADYLDGLPPEKMHCSVMGREALQAAIANYRGETWTDSHEEGALICKCFAVDSMHIEEVVRANGLTTVEQVTNYTKAGGGCASCHEGIEEILARVTGQPYATSKVDSLQEPAANAACQKTLRLTNFQRMRKIEETIESIRPMLKQDNGDIEIIEVDGKNIYFQLKGACCSCTSPLKATHLNQLQRALAEALGEFVNLLPISERAAA